MLSGRISRQVWGIGDTSTLARSQLGPLSRMLTRGLTTMMLAGCQDCPPSPVPGPSSWEPPGAPQEVPSHVQQVRCLLLGEHPMSLEATSQCQAHNQLHPQAWAVGAEGQLGTRWLQGCWALACLYSCVVRVPGEVSLGVPDSGKGLHPGKCEPACSFSVALDTKTLRSHKAGFQNQQRILGWANFLGLHVGYCIRPFSCC